MKQFYLQISLDKVFEKRHEFFKVDLMTSEVVQKNLNKKISNNRLLKLLQNQFSYESTVINKNDSSSEVLEFEQEFIGYFENGNYLINKRDGV